MSATPGLRVTGWTILYFALFLPVFGLGLLVALTWEFGRMGWDYGQHLIDTVILAAKATTHD